MKLRILVIDDSDGIRVSLRHMLSRLGHEVTAAADGLEGLDMLPSFKPDLVLTDMIMPGLDGVEVIGRIKKIGPNVKIVAMSGGSRQCNNNMLQRAYDAGADYIVSKPFELDELISFMTHNVTPPLAESQNPHD